MQHSGPASTKLKIAVRKNGPYIVSGGVALIAQVIQLDEDGQCLAWHQTKTYLEKQTYALCRCGISGNRPFCDGTHRRVNFDGTEAAGHITYLAQSEKFSGPALDLTDAKILCAHAGFCDRAGGTWELTLHSDDPKAKRTAIEEAYNCPSGRLVVWDKEGRAIEPVLEPSIALMESANGELSGPIWVRGGIPIQSADGELYEIRNRVTLCGCGKSAHKPFCDGTHRQKR